MAVDTDVVGCTESTFCGKVVLAFKQDRMVVMSSGRLFNKQVARRAATLLGPI